MFVLRKFVNTFSVYQLMIIALLAALGIAIKTVIVPLVHMVTGPLFIPGGAVAGGIYMMFLVLAVSLTGKVGAASLCGFVQAILVLITGMGGHHGALTIVSYTLTGLAIDLLMVIMRRHRGCCRLCCFFGGMAANLTGTLIVNAAFFALPAIPLMLVLCSAALSGGIGGLMAAAIAQMLRKITVNNKR